jgi:hypothetical protein
MLDSAWANSEQCDFADQGKKGRCRLGDHIGIFAIETLLQAEELTDTDG